MYVATTWGLQAECTLYVCDFDKVAVRNDFGITWLPGGPCGPLLPVGPARAHKFSAKSEIYAASPSAGAFVMRNKLIVKTN
jgi:hypothetical protein